MGIKMSQFYRALKLDRFWANFLNICAKMTQNPKMATFWPKNAKMAPPQYKFLN